MTNEPQDLPLELQEVLNILGQQDRPLSIQEISQQHLHEVSTRTLQRRIKKLQQFGLVSSSGLGRAIRYYLSTKGPVAEYRFPDQIDNAVSKQGIEIRKLVNRPIHERIPVNYRRDFLDSYKPNQTYYLDTSIREALWEVGKQPDGQQPAGTHAKAVLHRLLIDLSWNSSRLEGNTYSLLETHHLLEHGKAASGKAKFETQMILNHKAAIEFLVNESDEIQFNSYTLLNLHALLSHNLLSDPSACGRIRTIPVAIGKTVYQPIAIPQLLEECFQKILYTVSQIQDPFEQAFFLMVHLPYLQPFEDVNKRVSRLGANISLIKSNLSPISFIDVPKKPYIDAIIAVYELNQWELLRDIFVWAYHRSALRYSAIRHTLGEPDPFQVQYRDSIKQLIQEVILNHLGEESAATTIHQWVAQNIPKKDQRKLIEVIETELLCLHEGNIARFGIKLKEFTIWQKSWLVISPNSRNETTLEDKG